MFDYGWSHGDRVLLSNIIAFVLYLHVPHRFSCFFCFITFCRRQNCSVNMVRAFSFSPVQRVRSKWVRDHDVHTSIVKEICARRNSWTKGKKILIMVFSHIPRDCWFLASKRSTVAFGIGNRIRRSERISKISNIFFVALLFIRFISSHVWVRTIFSLNSFSESEKNIGSIDGYN